MNAIKINVFINPQQSPVSPDNLLDDNQYERWVFGCNLCVLYKITEVFSFWIFFPSKFLLGVWCAPTGFFSCLRSFVILHLFLTVYELPGRHTFIPDEDLVFFRLPQQLHLCLMELVLINHTAGWKRNTPANPA